MAEQWARVPTGLLQLVDAPAIALYVALCKRADKHGRVWATNPTLARDTSQSERSVIRALNQLADVRAVRRRGRARRVLTVAFLSDGVVTYPEVVSDTAGTLYVTQVSDVTRREHLDPHSLRSCDAATDEGNAMQAQPEEPLFEIETPEPIELPIGAACLGAFIDAYGAEPISRQMVGRLGAEFKKLAGTYSRAELLAAATELGSKHVASVNAVEPFLLRARQPQQKVRDGWSALAADTYAQMPDPFDQARSV